MPNTPASAIAPVQAYSISFGTRQCFVHSLARTPAHYFMQVLVNVMATVRLESEGIVRIVSVSCEGQEMKR